MSAGRAVVLGGRIRIDGEAATPTAGTGGRLAFVRDVRCQHFTPREEEPGAHQSLDLASAVTDSAGARWTYYAADPLTEAAGAAVRSAWFPYAHATTGPAAPSSPAIPAMSPALTSSTTARWQPPSRRARSSQTPRARKPSVAVPGDINRDEHCPVYSKEIPLLTLYSREIPLLTFARIHSYNCPLASRPSAETFIIRQAGWGFPADSPPNAPLS